MSRDAFPAGLIIAASLLVLFVVLPLAVTMLSTSLPAVLEAIVDPEVARSLGVTFLAGAISSTVGLILGLPLAYILARGNFPGRETLAAVVDLPMIIPHTAAGIALLLVFGRQGLLGRGFSRLGITFADSLGGIVVGMLFVSLPLLVGASREAFAAVHPDYEQAARVDGAGFWGTLWHVTLPLAWRGILSGAIMMWARGISEFGAVVILAYSPRIMPVLIYERFMGFGLASAQPVTVILIVVVLLLFALLRWLARSLDA
ncbi:MAG: ABC transporter permease [Chloroflexi bacterium]|nr:ABC transporter permease [Chloroflexota bacterium]